jgi:hypothetical protein
VVSDEVLVIGVQDMRELLLEGGFLVLGLGNLVICWNCMLLDNFVNSGEVHLCGYSLIALELVLDIVQLVKGLQA